MTNLLRIAIIVCLCPLASLVAAQLAGGQAKSERRFQAEIVSVDPARQTIRVRHKPTGYEAEIVWDANTIVSSRIKYDIDDLPEGWIRCLVKKVDSARKTMFRLKVLEQLPPPPARDRLRATAGFNAVKRRPSTVREFHRLRIG